MNHIQIVATGICVPEREVKNAELKERLEAENPDFVDKIAASSGIETRWYAPDSWATSDLVVAAGRDALNRGKVAAEDLDLIIVGTDSPDYITPSTSVVAQAALGANKAGTFDVGCACASFPTALANAAGLMATQPQLQNVLVVGAYMMHKLADPDDPMIFFYGDGAGAALLRRSETPGLGQAAFRADGSYARDWAILSGGTREPTTLDSLQAGRTKVRMEKKYPPQINDEGWPAVVRDLCKHNDVTPRDVDHYVFTQVRKRTIHKVMGFIEQPVEKAHTVMEKWGYTGSACIPMALHDLAAQGKLKAGELVFMVGSGVGYNQAGIALRVGDELANLRA
jgi:3-oxoacyl-[acyl-carrier-protein] synthase-3